jgi:hypothetical protein
MSTSGPFDKVKQYPSQLLGQFIAEPAPIHTYRDTIRIRKPYISFIFLDIDSIPTLTNIPLTARAPHSLIHDISPRRPELHAVREKYWAPQYDSDKPFIQSFNVTTSDSTIEAIVTPSAQQISLDVTFDPNDQRDIPASQLFSLEVLTSSIEATITPSAQQISLDVTFDPNDQRDIPASQLFSLEVLSSSIEATITPSAQQISLDVTFDPNDQRDIPTSQLFSLEALPSFIQEEISPTVQKVSIDVMFDSNDQRDQPVIQLHKPDVRTGSVERSISLIEQQVSVNATRDLDQNHKGISTNQYVVENILAQNINTTAGQEHQCDSYNHSMLIFEPSCYNYKIPETRTRSCLLRYHRYARVNRIASDK